MDVVVAGRANCTFGWMEGKGRGRDRGRYLSEGRGEGGGEITAHGEHNGRHGIECAGRAGKKERQAASEGWRGGEAS